MKAGVVDFLTKPFRDQDILDAMERDAARWRARNEIIASFAESLT